MQNKSTMEESIKVRIECLGQDAEEKITFFDAAVVDTDGTMSFESLSTKVDFRAIPLPTIGEKLVKILIRTNISNELNKEESETKTKKKENETTNIKKIADALLIFNDLEPWQQEINEQTKAIIYLIKIDANANIAYQETTIDLAEQNRSVKCFTINAINADNAKAILTKIGEEHYHKPKQEADLTTQDKTKTLLQITNKQPSESIQPESIEWDNLIHYYLPVPYLKTPHIQHLLSEKR